MATPKRLKMYFAWTKKGFGKYVMTYFRAFNVSEARKYFKDEGYTVENGKITIARKA